MNIAHMETADSDPAFRLEVTKLSCAGCVRRAETALAGASGARSASVNLATKSALVHHDGSLTPRIAAEALAKAGYPAAEDQAVLEIEGATCASCSRRIETALMAVPGVVEAGFNLATHQAHVRYLAGAARPRDLADAVRGIGYQAELGQDDQRLDAADKSAARQKAEVDALRRDTLIAAALTLPVVILAMGGHLIPAFHHWLGRRWAMARST